MLDSIVEANQAVTKASIPSRGVGQGQLWNSVDMEPLHMQHLMSNRPIRKIPVGRCKELNAVGSDVDFKIAATHRPAAVQSGVEDCFDA